MEGNFAQGSSYQDLQGFRDYKVGKLDFTGPCPSIDSCSPLLIKADIEFENGLTIDGDLTVNNDLIVKGDITAENDIYTDKIISNSTAATLGLGILCPNGPIQILTNGPATSTIAFSSISDFTVQANNIILEARTNEDIDINATTGTSDINITSNQNTNITSNANNIVLEAPAGIIQTMGNLHSMTSTDTTAMTSANATTITAVAGDVAIVSSATSPGGITLTATSGFVQTTTIQDLLKVGVPAISAGQVATIGTPNGPAMQFSNLTTGAVEGSITGPILVSIPTINGLVPASDRRVKDNIKKIDKKKKMERYNKLNKIDIVSYDYKNINGLLNINRHVDTGFTTQDLTAIGLDDCVVKQNEDAPQIPNTNAMIGLLINAVQVLQEKVKELEKEKPFTLKSHIV